MAEAVEPETLEERENCSANGSAIERGRQQRHRRRDNLRSTYVRIQYSAHYLALAQ